MKLLIASDVHGSARWCRALMAAIEAEDPATVVLLGDLLYHGPRNALPDEYDPQQVASMLNELAKSGRGLVAVRGNCDSEVDQMVLRFPMMADYAVILDGDRELLCSHGHLQTPESHLPVPAGGAFVSGHTHVRTCELRADGLWYVNPGSTSIPKDGTHGYAVYADGAFALRELAG